jgi:hypothetical protein
MVAMEGFDHLLNWKLKRGSHRFPGSDGGTCINEAALVAAGFEYRSICGAHEMPECFSRPICSLALFLNDHSTDEQRQHLLPFVTRLACADTPEVEKARADYIREQICNYHFFGVTFDKGLEVLEGALAIGRQADPLGPDEVQTRMDAARTTRSEPFFAKVKSWLTSKEIEPAV